ncbi:MAG: formyltransferase family protein [Flavobacteriales bacterium]
MKEPIKLIIFISGKGSNARNLVRYFKKHKQIQVHGIISSKQNPELFSYCAENQLFYAEYATWDEAPLLALLNTIGCDLIVLAGFLKKISPSLVAAYPNRIINIHPSLLPKYGGAGMYGRRVHEAVHKHQETQTGITIHLVNEHYDEGKILEQHTCTLASEDTPNDIEAKVRELELAFFPKAIESYCLSL